MKIAPQMFRIAKRRRDGFVLVAVLIVILLASMVAMSLLFRVRAEQTATAAGAGGDQAAAAAMSGIQEAMRLVKEAADDADWQDNPRALRDRFVFDDGVNRWYFSIYSAATDETSTEPRFGLTDEAGKLNINHGHQAELEKLPQLTAPLVEAARDFIDFDNVERQDGAEQEYYSALAQPYQIRNGPLDTLDELLLVRGFTPALLYGEDANMNFRLDANEDDGEERQPSDNKDGRLNLGLSRYLTTCTYEFDNDRDGAPRTNINNPRVPLPGIQLPPALTNFIAALRQAKGKINHVADLLEATGKFKDKSGKDVEIPSGVGPDELPLVLDLFCATDDAQVAGLINVNTASMSVLQTVPGIDAALAESIISGRRSIAADRRQTLAWLYQEKIVDAARFKVIAPHMTARGFQYSFRVAGYGMPSGRYCVLDVIIDMAGLDPVIRSLRDITRKGMPFAVGENATTITAQATTSRSVLECGSPLPLSFRVSSRGCRQSCAPSGLNASSCSTFWKGFTRLGSKTRGQNGSRRRAEAALWRAAANRQSPIANQKSHA
jgi:DNA uptake protein ComE-like DNA-binding protein